MKKILVTFATDRFKKSMEHLIETSKPHFDGVASYNDKMIEPFIKQNPQIFQYKRGFGYWAWKPYIILETLKKLNDGDIVFYIDSGNSIINDLSPIMDQIGFRGNGIILFENRDGNHEHQVWKNRMWTKYDCFHKMNCLEEKYINGDQIDGSYIISEKNEFTLKFYEEYLNYCLDPEIITDIPNKYGQNFPEFKDHRHDQSILSLLAIKYGIPLYNSPSEWGTRQESENPDFGQLFFHHHGHCFF